jgi:predicted amidophosphoribosyltransferase
MIAALGRAVRQNFGELGELVLPGVCVCCRAPAAHGCCATCRPRAEVRRTAHRLGFPVLAAGSYADELRVVLLHYKERRNRQLLGLLAGLLSEVLAEFREPDGLILVPVPSARAAARERGGNHVVRLARSASMTQDTVAPVLSSGRAGADSMTLTARQREHTIRGQVRAAPPGTGGSRVLLVDDIVTSGATLTECARALGAAGWHVLGAAVLAETVLRSARATVADSAP